MPGRLVLSVRFIAKWLLRLFNFAILVVLIAALLGRIVRDRNVALAMLMYLPLLPIGVAAVAIDAIQRGRAIPRLHFAMLGVGAIATLWSIITLTSLGESPAKTSGSVVRLIQWNTQWGGPTRSRQEWWHTASRIVERNPDIVVLNEAPSEPFIQQMCGQLRDAWHSIAHEEHRFNPHYQIRIVLASRFPIKLEAIHKFPHGAGIVVLVETEPKPMRVLAVDGISNPEHLRTPFLRAIADTCRTSSDNGQTIDVIAGDFNSVGCSLGFDAIEQLNYSRASRAHFGWVGTYPATFPLYDIDHVWLTETLSPRSCEMFSSPATNHRGQCVSIVR